MTSEPKVGQRICMFKEKGKRDSKEKAARTTVKKKKTKHNWPYWGLLETCL